MAVVRIHALLPTSLSHSCHQKGRLARPPLITFPPALLTLSMPLTRLLPLHLFLLMPLPLLQVLLTLMLLPQLLPLLLLLLLYLLLP